MNSIQQHLLSRVAHFTNVVNDVFPTLNFPIPEVEFYHKRKAAGLAWRKIHKVAFNTIIAQENIDKFDETIIHELSHRVTVMMHGTTVKPHGDEFQKINSMLGGRESRCNNYSLENVPHRTRKVERQFEYTCGCKTFKLTAVRHNRILKGQTYRCNDCHNTLIPVGQFRKAA